MDHDLEPHDNPLVCVLNLRMVTAGTELHDIMEDCLWLAKGEAYAGSLRA